MSSKIDRYKIELRSRWMDKNNASYMKNIADLCFMDAHVNWRLAQFRDGYLDIISMKLY